MYIMYSLIEQPASNQSMTLYCLMSVIIETAIVYTYLYIHSTQVNCLSVPPIAPLREDPGVERKLLHTKTDILNIDSIWISTAI